MNQNNVKNDENNKISDYVILIFFMSLFLCFCIFSLWIIFNILKNRKTKVSNLKVLDDEEEDNQNNIVELSEQNIQITSGEWFISIINDKTYGNRFHSRPL
jgi:cell division protein YceG involved in septum cleavage